MDIFQTPEAIILAIEVVMVAIAYFLLYPQFAGSSFKKISLFDSILTSLILLVVGYHYWGTGVEFNLLVIEVNWFWYTFITFSAIEVPVMLWYFKKHGVEIDIKK